MSNYFKLLEDDDMLIYEARYQIQFIMDLASAIPPGGDVTLKAEGLLAFLSTVQKQLPDSKHMEFVVD